MPKTEVLGIQYNNVTLDEAVTDVFRYVQGKDSRIVVTPNSEIAESCFSNQQLYESIKSADYIIPDGAGVVLASKICGTPLKERVSGFDLAGALLPLIEKKHLSVYILGAKPGVAEKAATNIMEKYPSINICGIQHGYFDDDNKVIDVINALSPNVLFVALGSPRQEIWMNQNKPKLNVGLMMGIGGGIDVFANVVKRAPKFYIKHNLEWFYRLVQQPSRFKRMLKLPEYFIRAVISRFVKKAGRIES